VFGKPEVTGTSENKEFENCFKCALLDEAVKSADRNLQRPRKHKIVTLDLDANGCRGDHNNMTSRTSRTGV
jgi:hypothetical protein